MLSRQTLLEITSMIERLPKADLDLLFSIYGLSHLISGVLNDNKTNSAKAKAFLGQMMYPSKPGPYSGDFHLDAVQYLVDRYYRIEDDPALNHVLGVENIPEIIIPNDTITLVFGKDRFTTHSDVIRNILTDYFNSLPGGISSAISHPENAF